MSQNKKLLFTNLIWVLEKAISQCLQKSYNIIIYEYN